MFPKSNRIGGVSPKDLLQLSRWTKRDCKLGFGDYVQVYAEHDITNTMQPRIYGAISMGAVENFNENTCS